MLTEYHVHIDFAYRTFRWDSEAKEKAAVHCVIIGFSIAVPSKPKYIYTNVASVAENINPYLVDAPDVLIAVRSSPLCHVPNIGYGNKPSDGGNLILSESERNSIICSDPDLAPYIRRYISSKDFLNNDEVRYCLWLKGVSPAIYRKNPEIMRRINAVQEFRLASSAADTRATADTPYLLSVSWG